jgi:hypothetical protein
MDIGQLYDRCASIILEHGRHLKVDMVTEAVVDAPLRQGEKFQVEQEVCDVAVPQRYRNGSTVPEPATSIKLLPEGF